MIPRALYGTVRRRAALVFGAALAIGLLHLALGAVHAPHDYYALRGTPWNDALLYHLAAQDLLDGWGLRHNASFPGFFQAAPAPGYILFLAGVYALGLGVGGVAILQTVAHALACALVYRIGVAASGSRAGLIAALSLALSRTQLDFARLTMTETLSVALGAGAVWAAVRPRPRLAVAAALVGVAATLRPMTLVLAPLLVLYALLGRGASRRAAAVALALALAPSALVAVRNGVVMGAYSPAATVHVWTLFSETVPPNPDSDDERFAAFAPLLDLPEREQRRHFTEATRVGLLAQPLRYLKRAYYLFESNFRVPAEQTLELAGMVLLPLLLVVLWGAATAESRPLIALLAGYAVAFTGATACFGESTGRFRLPVDWAITLVLTVGLLKALRLERPPEGDEAAPPPWPRALWGAIALALALTASLTLARIARAPEPERIALDPAQLGAAPLTFREYTRALFEDPKRVEGQVVAWPGVIDPIARFPAGYADPRSALTAARPHPWMLAAFQVDGDRGPLDGRRVFLVIPADLGASITGRVRAVVKARVETNLASASRERPRLVALGIQVL